MTVRFRLDRTILALMALGALLLAARAWLAAHPEHDPWAPLDLNDPPGWATQRKLAALRADPAECRAVLQRSGVAFTVLPPAGEGQCRREDRTVLNRAPLAPAPPPATCAIGAAFELWLRQGVQPAAEELLGSPVARIEHFGAYSCRRVYGRDEGPWSEHATGNALDVAAFVLADGRRVSLRTDWTGEDAKAAFLHRARDEACRVFGTVLSPAYNDAHADHLHLDQAARGFGGVCR
ncbi:MAG TPA: extensin family protein [Croceibacterium sp.]|nr:extensin family protein [Croceibacterium sp.]